MRPQTGRAIYPSLQGKKVIVSGGGSGIGAGFVEAFVEQGAQVAFFDVQRDASDALVERLADADIPPIFKFCDVTDNVDYETKISGLIERMGGCDVLINNAALDNRHTVEDVTSESWDECLAVNLKHQFFAAKAVIPAMKKAGGGSIINLGSISWHIGLDNLLVYQTAKAAVEGMTRSLAKEMGEHGIRANCIIPGSVKTPRQEQWYSPEGEAAIIESQSLNGRIMPVDIAAMALFLASDDARFCTAQNYWVDAGWR